MKICPYVQQLRVWLEAKNLSYDIEHIDSSNRPAWLYEASPDGGEVPVLITDDGEKLFQCDAIINYVDELYGSPFLAGSPIEKARQRAWGALASENYLTQCSTQRSATEDILKERMNDLTPILMHTEQHLSNRPYYLGRSISHVDLCWMPLLHRASLIEKHTGYDFLENYSKLKAWQQALLTTGLIEKTVDRDFEEIFCDFYLSNETYLGRLGSRSTLEAEQVKHKD
ncbi:glutathione S-transferase family protein [Rubellicoccus peritrichatus]|uniref:Glutathione S-transferase family protein n=1 Tax=Rubellicoccus peritrichatus TaxID=3080537 RepID=A0AAQ3LA15_9BACT|nr:glutathione S-transferase family protein [Puniceicoccus sp. CR14]WOO39643.1 glutathione S-transferase family protein [Puniceicoccus sp. CR14]